VTIFVHAHKFVNGVPNKAIVLKWVVTNASWRFKRMIGLCTAQCKCCCFVQNRPDRFTQFWISLSEDWEANWFWLFGDFLVQYFRDALSRHYKSCWWQKHSQRNDMLLQTYYNLTVFEILEIIIMQDKKKKKR